MINWKQIVGFIVIVFGIGFLIFSYHSTPATTEPEGVGQKISDFFTHNPFWNPILKFFGAKPQHERVLPSNHSAMVSMIAGGSLVILGAAISFFCRKKKKS